MNDDLISRSALKKEFDDKCAYECAICKYAKDLAPCKLIDNASTVLHDNYSMGYQDGVRKVLSERPHGEWLDEKFVAFHLTCNQCGCHLRRQKNEVFEGDFEYNFCPNCGACMIKEEEKL